MKKGKRKQFCPKGHNTFICGRDKWSACNQCVMERNLNHRLDPTKDSRIKQFCPKGHDTFIVGRTTHNGQCVQCASEHNIQYYQKHKIKLKRRSKKYRDTHVQEIKKWRRGFKKQNLKYIKKRLKEDINFRLVYNLRRRLRKIVSRNSKKGSAVRDLSCTVPFLKQYLESKFYGNMTWNNYNVYWQIDHIKPLWKFDLTNRKQFLEAVHYTNLQPLSIEDHKKKSAIEATERVKLKMKREKNGRFKSAN